MTVLAAGSALATGLPLAKNNFGDTEAGGMAGPLGLVVIILLAIATVLLIRNMNRRLRRLPARFTDGATSEQGLPLGDVSGQDHSDEEHSDRSEATGEGTARGESGSADQR